MSIILGLIANRWKAAPEAHYRIYPLCEGNLHTILNMSNHKMVYKINRDNSVIYSFLAVLSINQLVDEAVNEAVNETVNQAVSEAVRKRLADELLYIISENGITLSVIKEKYEIQRGTAQTDVRRLRDAGLIEFIGPPKTGKYILTETAKEKLLK